jgi:hypothetical protein
MADKVNFTYEWSPFACVRKTFNVRLEINQLKIDSTLIEKLRTDDQVLGLS